VDLGLTLLALMGGAGRAQDAAPPERDLSTPIRPGVLEASFPYQYRDTDGKLTGFSVDLSEAIVDHILTKPFTPEKLTAALGTAPA
jgi:ABC-type amino acid transport substrate-binding protein